MPTCTACGNGTNGSAVPQAVQMLAQAPRRANIPWRYRDCCRRPRQIRRFERWRDGRVVRRRWLPVSDVREIQGRRAKWGGMTLSATCRPKFRSRARYAAHTPSPMRSSMSGWRFGVRSKSLMPGMLYSSRWAKSINWKRCALLQLAAS